MSFILSLIYKNIPAIGILALALWYYSTLYLENKSLIKTNNQTAKELIAVKEHSSKLLSINAELAEQIKIQTKNFNLALKKVSELNEQKAQIIKDISKEKETINGKQDGNISSGLKHGVDFIINQLRETNTTTTSNNQNANNQVTNTTRANKPPDYTDKGD